jgi:hypothetical protein
VLLRRKLLERIRAGEVDLVFRRWTQPRVRPGTRMRTPVGVLEVVALDVIERASIDAQAARRAGFDSPARLLAMLDARAEGEIHRIELRYAGPDPRIALRERSAMSADELDQVKGRLARMDASSRHGPWTRPVLELIRDRPEVRAPDLAASLGRETQPFKRDVRRLKELGLTESLERGYRLSPRGRAVLARLD